MGLNSAFKGLKLLKPR